MSQEKTSKRFWKFKKLEKSNCIKTRDKIKIKKALETKKGLDSDLINRILKCSPHFIGCFAENEIKSLYFGSLPCFLIVNLDSSYMVGSHWIGIGIFKNKIEVFDSLGFDIFNWPRVPCTLMRLLQQAAVSKRVRISKRLQPDSSSLCGLYSIFYPQQVFLPYLVLTDQYNWVKRNTNYGLWTTRGINITTCLSTFRPSFVKTFSKP